MTPHHHCFYFHQVLLLLFPLRQGKSKPNLIRRFETCGSETQPAGKHSHLLLKERLAAVCEASQAGEQKPSNMQILTQFLVRGLAKKQTFSVKYY